MPHFFHFLYKALNCLCTSRSAFKQPLNERKYVFLKSELGLGFELRVCFNKFYFINVSIVG